MKICREVNGVPMEFELTTQETMQAYYDKERQWDEDYVVELAQYLCDDDDGPVEMLNALRSDPELRRRVASRYRKYLDDIITTDNEFDCLKWAYEYITRD